ncbi:hypothetical protein BT69DRAFT_1281287 [Atractiella rhizophila]|nr:hypothetical protein BT69DRAFT_1281287 [Atractiella rhizophila]
MVPLRFTLLVGSRCQLCHSFSSRLFDHPQAHNLTVKLVDIQQTEPPAASGIDAARFKELKQEWRYDIPVLMYKGKEVMMHRFDDQKFEELLRNIRSSEIHTPDSPP